jgi:hypothetical protein
MSIAKRNTTPLEKVTRFRPGIGQTIPESKLESLNWNAIENEAQYQ